MKDSRYFVIKHLPARCPRLTLLDAASPLGRLSHYWSAVTDPRWQRRPSHLLHEILLMSLYTCFTGGRTLVDMAHFALSHQSWLATFLILPRGLPCHDTFNRVFSALDPRQLEDALQQPAKPAALKKD